PNSRREPSAVAHAADPARATSRTLRRALATSLPMSLWVFSAVTLSVVTMAARVSSFEGPWVPGVAAVLALGSGVISQDLARRGVWGPRAGVLGALLVAVGLTVVAVGGSGPSPAEFIVASILLGSGYGLCLREGLLDVETYAPAERLGLATGIFYVGTYLGFGLPVLLRALAPSFGITAPIVVLAVMAAGSAAVRAAQIRGGMLAGR
ncbi:MAG: MFS transporter, partial [Gordonia sp. (in: high G+C Gram-positive bacteria)]